MPIGKIDIIRQLREEFPGLGLKDCKDVVDAMLDEARSKWESSTTTALTQARQLLDQAEVTPQTTAAIRVWLDKFDTAYLAKRQQDNRGCESTCPLCYPEKNGGC